MTKFYLNITCWIHSIIEVDEDCKKKSWCNCLCTAVFTNASATRSALQGVHDTLIKSYGNMSYNSWCITETSKAGSFLFPRDHAFLFHILTLMIYSCLGSVSSTTMSIHFKTSESTIIQFFCTKVPPKGVGGCWVGIYSCTCKPLPKHKFRSKLSITKLCQHH